MLHRDGDSNSFNRGRRQVFSEARKAYRVWGYELRRRLLPYGLQCGRSRSYVHFRRQRDVFDGLRAWIVLAVLRERREPCHSDEQHHGSNS